MAVEGQIAESARGEIPMTWDALIALPKGGTGGPVLSEAFLRRRVVSAAMYPLFGRELTSEEEEDLNPRIVEYAGKLVALTLITPGRDYWNKQAVSLGATGRNETKTYLDRAAELTTIRAELIEATRAMWPEVEGLLPNRTVRRVASVPRTQRVVSAVTPDPDLMGPPYAV